jgi:putative transcriptional regulator
MEAAGIGTTTLSKLGKDQFVSMEVLVKICKVLKCNIGDIVEIVSEEE